MKKRFSPRPRKGALLLAGLLALPLLAQQMLAQQPAPAPPAAPADAAAPAAPARPGWLEGLLYNPAERTAKGAAAIGAGAPKAAAAALDSAVRLDPADDRTRYNAGTAHLLATSEQAAPLLAAAARSSDNGVASRAFYNLGNSRLAAQDLPGAIEAYKDSLRRDPASADAKFNLELALRRLQEQQKQDQKQDPKQDQQKQDQQEQQDQQKQDQQEQQEQQDKGQQGEDSQEKEGQQDQQKQDQQKQDQQGQGQGEQQPPGQGEPPPQQQPGQKGEESPLPQFHDLPDMDAQQAAAILEAIENLERSQRRDDAKKALKANASGKKDW